MAISEKISELVAENQQRDRAVRARAILQEVRMKVQEVGADLQEIADSGAMNTIDTEIRDALVKGWDVVKATQSGFEDSDLTELLDWRE